MVDSVGKDLHMLNIFIIKFPLLHPLQPGIANRGVGGTTPLPPPRDGPKNQLTFLFKAFFSFFPLIISYTLWYA